MDPFDTMFVFYNVLFISSIVSLYPRNVGPQLLLVISSNSFIMGSRSLPLMYVLMTCFTIFSWKKCTSPYCYHFWIWLFIWLLVLNLWSYSPRSFYFWIRPLHFYRICFLHFFSEDSDLLVLFFGSCTTVAVSLSKGVISLLDWTLW